MRRDKGCYSENIYGADWVRGPPEESGQNRLEAWGDRGVTTGAGGGVSSWGRVSNSPD